MITPSSHTGLSYKDRRSHQKRRFRFVGVVLLVILLFLVFSTFVLQPWVFETAAMEPGYPVGSRVLVSPYLITSPSRGLRRSPERGDIVMVAPPYVEELHWRFKILDPVVRMVTFQKARVKPAGLKEWESERLFKRVVAVPGDTVRIKDSVAHVRSADNSYFISEFEMSGQGYDISIPELPAGWTDDMPLSGLVDEILLQEGEYFLLGDNRAASNDSRYWGPVDESRIRGRALMIYWPFRYFGRSR